MNNFALDFSPLAEVGKTAISYGRDMRQAALDERQMNISEKKLGMEIERSDYEKNTIRPLALEQMKTSNALAKTQADEAQRKAEIETKETKPVYIGSVWKGYEKTSGHEREAIDSFLMANSGTEINGQVAAPLRSIREIMSSPEKMSMFGMLKADAESKDIKAKEKDIAGDIFSLQSKLDKKKAKYGELPPGDEDSKKMEDLRKQEAELKSRLVSLGNARGELKKKYEEIISMSPEMMKAKANKEADYARIKLIEEEKNKRAEELQKAATDRENIKAAATLKRAGIISNAAIKRGEIIKERGPEFTKYLASYAEEKGMDPDDVYAEAAKNWKEMTGAGKVKQGVSRPGGTKQGSEKRPELKF
jgi:hypothetical protein